MGSRYTDPLSGGKEDLTTTTQTMDTLRVERAKSNLSLEATKTLTGVRLSVIRGNYDQALEDTKWVLQQYYKSGKAGEAMAKDLGQPLQHVVHLIKLSIDKRILVAKDCLERGNHDKALKQIPTLRDAVLWLRSVQVTYPEAREPTHWESRRNITGEDFPEGMSVIEELTEQITAAQAAHSLDLELGSLGPVFSQMRPVINMKDAALVEALASDASRRDRLPPDVVADGRTYAFSLNVRPPELPDV
eukprot:CAMPEP_0169464418 /NCGR_PEP_ID=MMETSP1042-20121227/20656_1 /TAXON_ID=464988 /ORGANISM="Hemiselmis andersenii, Strain CCMP1180" /LENGTH=245 /DNA_ID=CAMNT_0009577267 /DNA_START=30 /DNA_END=764 /DNA_ORIENTATION=-